MIMRLLYFGLYVGMQMRLENGADCNHRNKYQQSPLHFAASLHSDEIVKMLTQNGSDINAIDKDGQTPIFYIKDYVILEAFINNGSTPDPNLFVTTESNEEMIGNLLRLEENNSAFLVSLFILIRGSAFRKWRGQDTD